MMSFINFRTAILCCACCLCTVSVNAQEIVVDLSTGPSFTESDSTGDLIEEAIDGDMDIFETTLNAVSYTHLTLPTICSV